MEKEIPTNTTTIFHQQSCCPIVSKQTFQSSMTPIMRSSDLLDIFFTATTRKRLLESCGVSFRISGYTGNITGLQNMGILWDMSIEQNTQSYRIESTLARKMSEVPLSEHISLDDTLISGQKRKAEEATAQNEENHCSPCNGTTAESQEVKNNQMSITSKKRRDAMSWDDYFMSVAFLSSMRSKDPSTQVGACIVNSNKRIVGIGYNGFPRGCSDDELPWTREGACELDTKYPYVCHAEVNAILNKNSADVAGCSIYVGLFPCNECAKVIIQSGIQEVVFMSDKYADTTSMKASRRMFNLAKVSLRQYTPTASSVMIDFASIHGSKQEDVTHK